MTFRNGKFVREQKIKQQRKWVSRQNADIWRFRGLLKWPIIWSATMSILWFLLHSYRVHFHHESTDAVTTGFMPLPVMVYAIFGGLVVSYVAKKNSIIHAVVGRMHNETATDEDFLSFFEYRDRHIHPASHLMLLILALYIVVSAVMLDYGGDKACGLFVVGGSTFLLSLMREVTNELDNPFSGIDFVCVEPDMLELKFTEWKEKREAAKKPAVAAKLEVEVTTTAPPA